MITLDHVSFAYKGTEEESLREISLHIEKGECVLLCGGSGCGKTTLTRLINGLIPHFYEGTLSGSVTVDGKSTGETDIATLSDRVGSVFQNPRTQFFNTDTDSEIVFGLENRGYSSETMREMLDRITEELDIGGLRARNIFELSGGEKQKIAFASVYALEPEIFVLDEPSSNLDRRSVEELRELLRQVKSKGKTVVIAEHRLWYLTDIADRVIVMKEGRILRDMDIRTFRALSDEEAGRLQLRSRSLPKEVPIDSSAGFERPRFEVRGLRVRRDDRTVLEDLSFVAYSGEILAITGDNGAGKTTLARTVCGLLRESSGTISLDGKPLSPKECREKSYMVMQDVGHQLFTDSVEEECRLGVRPPSEETIREVLTRLSLAELRERHPMSLSGGQKQRLAVAVGKISGKELLIFDEPTSGLDRNSMRKVGDLMRSLAEEGKVVLVITHDEELIESVCSRVLRFSGRTLRETEDSPGTEQRKGGSYEKDIG